MRVRVLYFGVLKEIFGRERDVLEIEPESDVRSLLETLRQRGETAPEVWRSIAVAVNQEYVAASTLLQDEDEVALLPPVSGGLEG